MRIACVRTAAELDSEATDLVVLPEGVDPAEILAAASMHPEAAIVAAIREGAHSRAVIWHGSKNHVEYLKVETDGRTVGTGNHEQSTVAHFQRFSVGVLICMDVQNPQFSARVVESLRASENPIKVLCIPADMGSYWFEGPALSFPARYAGVYVALCNSTETHEARCRSFIANCEGTKIVIQSNAEPIVASAP